MARLYYARYKQFFIVFFQEITVKNTIFIKSELLI